MPATCQSVTEELLRSWMIAGLSGDAKAHARLLSALAPRLRAYFRRRLGADAAEAEDLMQETLIAIHVKRGTYDPDRPLTPWILALARYKLIDAWRRRKARPTTPLPEDDILPDDDKTDSLTAARDLEVLLAHLPDRQQAVMRNVKLEGLSLQEAAGRRGMTLAAVKVTIHRALKVLQSRAAASSEEGE